MKIIATAIFLSAVACSVLAACSSSHQGWRTAGYGYKNYDTPRHEGGNPNAN